MITGQINEKVVPYRQKEGLNYSSIKTFDTDGVGVFYKEYILGQKDDKQSNALAIGSLVDDMVLTYGGDLDDFHQHFDEKYAKFDGVKSSAQAFDLADALFDSLKETMGNDGKITGNFEACFKEAFDKVQAAGKYKGKTWDKGLEDFEKVARQYFETKINSIGKIIIDLKIMTIAENVTKILLTDDFTASLLKGEQQMLVPKVEIEFTYMDVKCKAEIDFVLIDHLAKTVQGGDLKCTFDNESFAYMYIKNSYYLQQAFYSLAIANWMLESDLMEYKRLPFMFVVADTSVNNRRPLIYQLSEEDEKAGFEGFKMNGREYKGVKTLVEEIKWHISNEIWNCSKETIENNGILNLNIKYE